MLTCSSALVEVVAGTLIVFLDETVTGCAAGLFALTVALGRRVN